MFSETQRFKQIWLWIILLGINGLFIFGLTKQVILGKQFGDNPLSNWGLIIVTTLIFLFSLLFLNLKLDTYIKTDGIYVRFFPLHFNYKYFSWDSINQSFVRQYNPIGEYGGWGIRGFGKNRALNISGNKGIQLIKKDGSRLLIGTKKADEVTEILKKTRAPDNIIMS